MQYSLNFLQIPNMLDVHCPLSNAVSENLKENILLIFCDFWKKKLFSKI